MKKLIALLLVLLMTVSLMTACGKDNTEPTWNFGVPEGSQQTQPQETDDVASGGDVESFPATGGDLDEFDYNSLPASDGDLND